MIALLGILSILALAVICSDNRRRIPLRTVGLALCLQIMFAGLVLWLPAGQHVLNGVSESVSSVIGYGQEGIAFLFGDLAKFKLGFIFAFNVLPVIIFFSAVIAILYHIGIMPRVIALLGGGLQKLLGTGRAESLSATANIFVGMVEAPLVVKPYLSKMSDSQFFAVMSCGLASVAGGTTVGYASLGVELKYLIAAAFMSAPAGLAMAKILVPPGAEEVDHHQDVEIPRATNVIEAAADGAMSGLNIAVAVGATLLAFVGVIAMLNGLLGWAGGLVGLDLSFQIILGWLLPPSLADRGTLGSGASCWRSDRYQDRGQRVRRLYRSGAGSDPERVEQGHRDLRPVRLCQHLLHGDPDRRSGLHGAGAQILHRPLRHARNSLRRAGKPDERLSGRSVPRSVTAAVRDRCNKGALMAPLSYG